MTQLFNDIKAIAENIKYNDIELLKEFIVEKDWNNRDYIAEVFGSNNCQRWHYALGWVLNPQRVGSIGVRYGYDSISTFIGARDRGGNLNTKGFYGFDNESYEKDSNRIASSLLNSIGVNTYIRKVNTQDISNFNDIGDISVFDLFYVDGIHSSLQAVYHDLILAWKKVVKNGYMIVDDYFFLDDVKEGTNMFLNNFRNETDHIKIPQHLRGLVIIKKV